jgi:hypothetical protein
MCLLSLPYEAKNLITKPTSNVKQQQGPYRNAWLNQDTIVTMSDRS